MQEPSDRALVLRTREGEVDAYGDLVRRYQSMVFNTCFRLCGERRQAEDLTQETFLRAYERLHTFDEGRPFAPWIRTVAANLCYNHLESGKAESWELGLEDEVVQIRDTGQSAPEQIYERKLEDQIVRAAILRLPPQQRTVIELRHFQSLSYEEISAALDISVSKVKTDLFRARKTLERLLEDLDR